MTEAVYKAAAHALKAAVQETGAGGAYPPKEFYKEKKCMILLPAIDIKDGTCVRLQREIIKRRIRWPKTRWKRLYPFRKSAPNGSIWWIWMALKTPLW